MASFNRVMVIGNITRDPEVRYLQSGTAVCDLGLAVNDRHKGANGEYVDDVVFVDVTTFGRQAEIAGEFLTRGSPCFIEGRLKLDQWTDKDGNKRSKLKVVCERLQLLDRRPSDGSSVPKESLPNKSSAQVAPVETGDDIPF